MKNKLAKKIWNIVTTVLVALAVLCAVFLMSSRLLGYQVYTVISGSMEPEYSVGDLLYVKPVDVNTIQVDDPITFVLNEDLAVATHRVVRVDAENQYFYTKGDANDTEDVSPVHFKNVIGVPKFAIPKLGYVSDFVQNSPGRYITIGLGIVLVLLMFFPDLIGKKKKVEEDAEIAAAREEIDAPEPDEPESDEPELSGGESAERSEPVEEDPELADEPVSESGE